jgi:hypothetical protein
MPWVRVSFTARMTSRARTNYHRPHQDYIPFTFLHFCHTDFLLNFGVHVWTQRLRSGNNYFQGYPFLLWRNKRTEVKIADKETNIYTTWFIELTTNEHAHCEDLLCVVIRWLMMLKIQWQAMLF